MAVMEDELRKEAQKVISRKKGAVSDTSEEADFESPSGGWRHMEDLALQLICHSPEQVPEYLDEKLFANPINKDTLRALCDYESLDEILAVGNLDADVREEIIRLRVTTPAVSPQSVWLQLLLNAANRRCDEIALTLKSSDTAVPVELNQQLANIEQAIGTVRQKNFTLQAAEQHSLPLL